ncbi:Mannosyl phosphorylinositol ceramide synthase SUR1 [Fusarium oxysporum f. sp. albedinis]|nr:Mannosyl phosphorylinositol ceramide synthase SUR1 [Fusarium oxysporum f. sp. albedinis]KAK2473680.1 hypothetical protein H9L39_13640 [Fusarium oxysporum f. sp. albedinis]
MHHCIRSSTIAPVDIGRLSAGKESDVGPQDCLVLERFVELPSDNHLGMVLQVLSHARQVVDDLDAKVLKLFSNAYAEEESNRGVIRAGAQNGFLLGIDAQLATKLQSNVHTSGEAIYHVDAINPGVG